MTIKEGVTWGLILLVIIVGVGVGVAQATGNIEDAYVPALTAALVLVTTYYATMTGRIFKANIGAVKATKDASLGQIVIQLTTAYAQPEMLISMRRLKDFKNKNGKDFAKKFIELETSDKPHYDQLNGDRRRFSHYFNTIYVLLDTGVIDVEFLKRLVRPGKDDPVDFLLEVIEPLEKAINAGYDTKSFVRFQEIYQKSSPMRDTSSSS